MRRRTQKTWKSFPQNAQKNAECEFMPVSVGNVASLINDPYSQKLALSKLNILQFLRITGKVRGINNYLPLLQSIVADNIYIR